MVPIREAPETLHALRRAVAELATLPGEDGRLISLGVASLDQALAGGLAGGALHEIGPAAPLHGGAATGFALALAVRALRPCPTCAEQSHMNTAWPTPPPGGGRSARVSGPGGGDSASAH